jgi:hypothetical protein
MGKGEAELPKVQRAIKRITIKITTVINHSRFEISTAVTMKNVIFWVINTQFVLHRKLITSPLQGQACECYVRFEVFTAVTK